MQVYTNASLLLQILNIAVYYDGPGPRPQWHAAGPAGDTHDLANQLWKSRMPVREIHAAI